MSARHAPDKISPEWALSSSFPAIQERPPSSAAVSASAKRPAIATWRDAKVFAAWHLHQLGFADAKATLPGVDEGVDIVSKGAVAQVKHCSDAIGAPMVQQLHGAAHGKEWAVIYAFSGYTRAAIDLAKQANVALFTYNETAVVEPQNQAARFLLASCQKEGTAQAEDFRYEQGVRHRTQEIFDGSWRSFSEVAEEIIAQAHARGAQTEGTRALEVDLAWLMPAMEILRDTENSSVRDTVALCERIRGATRRLRADHLAS